MLGIRQDDKSLLPEIRKWGCYLLALHYYVQKFKGLKFTPLKINAGYHKFIKMGAINSNCYVLDPCKILDSFDIRTTVRREPSFYVCRLNEFEISKVKFRAGEAEHFIASSGDKVLYDSLNLVESGYKFFVDSKRVFTKKF